MFTDNISSYKSTPVVVGYEQDLFGFNDLKWERRIEPIKYEEAKKTYIGESAVAAPFEAVSKQAERVGVTLKVSEILPPRVA